MKHLLVALVAFAVSEPVMAQSPLAEAARREAERRKQARPGQVQVVTNDDVMKLPQRSASATPAKPPTTVTTIGAVSDPAAPAQPAAGAAAQPGAAQPTAAEARNEEYWRKRITAARDNLSRLELSAEAFESRINALTADFVNRDDPAQRQQIFEARQKALTEFDRVKAEIAAAVKAIADIEEEARRLNVPAGWLR